MNDRAMAIAALCSHLGAGGDIQPLTPAEYSALVSKLDQRSLTPEALLSFGQQDFREQLEYDEPQAIRLLRLIERGASLSFELSRYENMGVALITRADALYPAKLKAKLKNACPPLFYAAGNLSLLGNGAIGYVGARSAKREEIAFTQALVRKTTAAGYAVVSGGAKGIDSVAEEAALLSDGSAIAYLSDSMLRKLRNKTTLQAVQQGRLLLLSAANPDAGFNVGMAMMRNKYIYAQSEATVVVKADYNKGGTWAGAVENLRKSWAVTLCWNHPSFPGNKALMEKGAIPIDADWDGDIRAFKMEQATKERKKEQEIVGKGQLSLFGDDSGAT